MENLKFMNDVSLLISVVITTKNEEKNIENCLKSINDQSYPQDKIEIIVVDNNSTDKTKELAENFGKGLASLNMKVFNGGPERSAQRNFGVEKSRGEWFLYLDADMILSENVIKNCVEKATVIPVRQSADKHPAGIQSPIALHISEIIMGEKFWSKVRRFERSFYDGTAIDGVRFIKKSEFQKVGGFDENLTGPEDWDLDKKLKKIGKLDLAKTPIYHNEEGFHLKKYLNKKAYYAQKFNEYIVKWGKNDPDIKKQFGLYYRFFGVFVENGKWKNILIHPILTLGIFTLRFLVGLKYVTRKK